jgi:hypothetical protein
MGIGRFAEFPINCCIGLKEQYMKNVLIAIARRLVAAARDRAQQVTRKQAEARLFLREDYTANAGGWN